MVRKGSSVRVRWRACTEARLNRASDEFGTELSAEAALERRVAEPEDSALLVDEPIPLVIGGRGDAYDRRLQRNGREVTKGGRAAEGMHCTSLVDEPITGVIAG